jgi:hypothetical protein
MMEQTRSTQKLKLKTGVENRLSFSAEPKRTPGWEAAYLECRNELCALRLYVIYFPFSLQKNLEPDSDSQGKK